MRRILFFSLLLFVLVVSACAPEAAATEVPATPESEEPATPTKIPVGLTPAQLAAIDALSESSGLPADEIKLISTEAVDWPDGCLGVQLEGLMCTQVIVPGFRIILEANGREVEYHTSEAGTQIRPATVLMTWTREGGIAGFCDHLTVYLSGEVYKTSCKSNEFAEEQLTGLLSNSEVSMLDTWIESYGDVNINASDPKGVSDRMVVTLEFMGLGSQQTVSAANERALLDFAQSLNQEISQ